MGSRRPMSRSLSGDGRSVSGNERSLARIGRSLSCSESEEDAATSSARSDSRSYLINVRPENRSTLCSVMAHLTEETQPSFEKTLKSKAVSEACNVKFTCVISGYPVPELTWYKDDMEMDRYCGLPKYEIFRHGRTHSLHIYNCTEEDAAIYQASARNCKGIVSCSGVLEVGAMNEYRIHQRFFAKLKQKADSKQRELEESRKRGKENQPRTASPERVQRKRRTPGGADPGIPPLPLKGVAPAAVEREAQMKATEMPNGLPDVLGAKDARKEDARQDVWNIRESLGIRTISSPTKEPLAKKKIKMTNGTASKDIHQQASQATGAAMDSEGGMSLSQYLAAESQQAKMPMQPKEVKQPDKERGQGGQAGPRAVQSTKSSPKAVAKGQTVKSESGHASTQSPLTSVFFSLRDIFFGSKKKREDEATQNSATKMEEDETPTCPVPPGTSSQLNSEPVKEEAVHMDSEETALSVTTRVTNSQVSHPTEQQAPRNVTTGGLLQGLLYTSREEPAGRPPEQEVASSQNEHRADEGGVAAVASSVTPLAMIIPQPVHTCMVLHEPMQIEGNEGPGAGDMDVEVTARQTTAPAAERAPVQDTKPHDMICHSQMASNEWTQKPEAQCEEGAEILAQQPEDPQMRDTYNKGDVCRNVDLAKEDDMHVNANALEGAERIFKTWGKTTSIEEGKPEVEIEETIVIVVKEPESSCHSQTSTSLEFKQPDSQVLENTFENAPERSHGKEISEDNRESSNSGLAFHTSLQEGTMNVPKVVVTETKDIEAPQPLVDNANQPLLETWASRVSELVDEKNQAKVSFVVPEVISEQQRIQNDAILSTTEKTLQITQQDEKKGTGRDLDEISTSDQGTKAEDAPYENVSLKGFVLPSSNDVELSNNNPTILVIPTQTNKVVKDMDTKEPNEFHSEGMQASVEKPDTTEAPREPTIDHDTNIEHEKGRSLTETTISSPEASLLTPSTLQDSVSQKTPDPGTAGVNAVPLIRVENIPSEAERSSGKETPPSAHSHENSPKLKRKDSLSLSTIPSATPEELALGARRKIFAAKAREDDLTGVMGFETQWKKDPDSPNRSPSQVRRASSLQTPAGQNTPPTERHSPHIGRKKTTLEVPKHHEEMPKGTETSKTEEEKPAEKLNPFKAPQVIRKIRGELFSDASGHLKLWCQFFNVLSDSTIKWYRDEVEIAEVKRRAGDESQVALAIVQVTSRDCGVYGCSIKNEYGTDSTDYLLSADILSQFFLREDIEVGEEVEMTPLLFAKGLADPGCWGTKLFGRIMSQEPHMGEGCAHKTSRVKAIYGLEPVFESGSTCILKVRNPIAYGTQEENSLMERNMQITKQECKVQNTVREYCKIFTAETRTIENFGSTLEVVPQYLMYRPANVVPYATVEADLKGLYLKYCLQEDSGRLVMRTTSEAEQKCCTFQHWIHQWTSGNLLVTQLEGVDLKITNVGVVTKSVGYQGLTDDASPQIFEQFASQHQCNYYCGLLGLRTLRPVDHTSKSKASKSPLLARKVGGSSSPQQQRKGTQSPQAARKSGTSPKVPRKTESGENKTNKQKTTETAKAV